MVRRKETTAARHPNGRKQDDGNKIFSPRARYWNMRILLLGSTGLLGNNVLRALLRHGHKVSLVVRHRRGLVLSDLSDAELQRVSIFQGNYLVPSVLWCAAQGCEGIVHCAGTTDMSLLNYRDYLPVNRDACKLLLQLMQRQGIHRLVHVSTANTIGYGSPQAWANEHSPMQYPFTESYYALSKREGETVLTAYASRHPGDHVVVVNPGFMLGAYDVKPSSGQLLLAAYRRPWMICPKGGKGFIPASDVAEAVVNAIFHGTSGERYLLTGENLSLEEFYRLQAATMGYRQRLILLPDWLVLGIAKCGDLLRALGIKAQLCTRNVRQLLIREYYDSTHATSDLHLPHTPLSQAISDFFEWHSRRPGKHRQRGLP